MTFPRLSVLLLAYVTASPATTLYFWDQSAYLRNLPVDKYLSQGLLLANSAATPQNTQLCIGDIPMPPPQFQMRQLVSCVTGPVTLTFTLVDPKKLGPMPASAFVMTVTFRSLGVNGVYPQEPWKISAFDANHNLLEMQQGMTGVQNYEPRAQTFTFYPRRFIVWNWWRLG